jgi:tight adherence protein B
MSHDDSVILAFVVVVAVSAALLTWFVIEMGSGTMARYRATFTERAKFQAREFFLFIDPRTLFVANLALMAIGGALTWAATRSALLGLAAFGGLALAPRILYWWMRQKRLRTFEEQLPDALMMLAGGLRAGVGLSTTIQQLVSEAQPPISQEFSLLLREQRMGVVLEQALTNLNRRVPTPTTVLVVSAMRVATETGGGLAETLERTAQTIRSRLQMEGKISALTAQGKLQAWVVGLLPVVLALILDKMEPEAMSMLWHTPIGWGTLAVIGFLEAMGIYVIRKIIAIDV